MPTLTWTGKEDALRTASSVPFRLLEPHEALEGGSFGDPATTRDNLLIQGDNLEALKALLPYYAGRVKCIYIDPPYNTGSAFEHYDDNLEHSTWLSMMYPRLELLRELLAEEGSIWVNLDDNEGHYFKVITDEVFGRRNFIANVVWQKRTSPDARLKLSGAQDNIYVYAKNVDSLTTNKIEADINSSTQLKNLDNDSRGPWTSTDFTAMGWRPNQMYTITTPGGVSYTPPEGRCWANLEENFLQLVADNRIWFGKNCTSRPRTKNFLSESEGKTPWTWWTNLETGHNQEAKKEANQLFGAFDAFATPKPERLIKRILEIASNRGDLVLDSFLGSGTTAAVAQKMGRKWIGIEMGDHAVTHCLPRLKKVVEGEQGGISEAVGWKGGGGFRFARLGETLFDAYGRLNPKVKFADLAAFVWWRETKEPAFGGSLATDSPLLGIHEGRAVYLLYNGILGDWRPVGGNVLTSAVLASLPRREGPRVVYAEATTYSPASLARMSIVLKQIPYDLGSMPLLAEGALEFAAAATSASASAEASETQAKEGDHV